jgi:hypothetical protein
MITHTILRVEDRDGTGPYNVRVGKDYESAGQIATNADHFRSPESPGWGFVHHPVPRSDPGLAVEWQKIENGADAHSWCFGFADVAQLKEWFNTEQALSYLKEKGLRAVRYEVPDYCLRAGTYQICFLKRGSRAQAVIELTALS